MCRAHVVVVLPNSKPLPTNNIIFSCSVREFMSFTSDMLVQRTGPGQRQSVKEQGIYVYVLPICDGLCYSSRV